MDLIKTSRAFKITKYIQIFDIPVKSYWLKDANKRPPSNNPELPSNQPNTPALCQ